MTDRLFNTADDPSREFENIYLQVRKAEQRLYTDKEVERLPSISKEHIHYKEWQIRKASLKNLIKHLQRKKKPLKILEIGCGNGWFSAALANAARSWTVTGTDINTTELDQATRVFGSIQNLNFSFFDVYANEVITGKYDVIVFAASVQYFSSLTQVIEKSLSLLSPIGEIHLIDTIFYKNEMLAAAKERTDKYFSDLGYPMASKYYFHHSLEDLTGFEFVILEKPATKLQKLFGNRSPFYWISVKKNHS